MQAHRPRDDGVETPPRKNTRGRGGRSGGRRPASAHPDQGGAIASSFLSSSRALAMSSRRSTTSLKSASTRTRRSKLVDPCRTRAMRTTGKRPSLAWRRLTRRGPSESRRLPRVPFVLGDRDDHILEAVARAAVRGGVTPISLKVLRQLFGGEASRRAGHRCLPCPGPILPGPSSPHGGAPPSPPKKTRNSDGAQ